MLKQQSHLNPKSKPLRHRDKAASASSYSSMSYANPNPTASTSARGRVAAADEKNKSEEASSEHLSSPPTSRGQAEAGVAHEQHGGGSGGDSSPSGASGSGGSSGHQRGSNMDDMDGVSSGNDSGERESEGGMERETHGRESTRSSHSSCNGKDSGLMLETTESNKR